MKNVNEIEPGNKVFVLIEGQEATVIKKHIDGDFLVQFADGDEGSYSNGEVMKRYVIQTADSFGQSHLGYFSSPEAAEAYADGEGIHGEGWQVWADEDEN
jgi:hypothetical protein